MNTKNEKMNKNIWSKLSEYKKEKQLYDLTPISIFFFFLVGIFGIIITLLFIPTTFNRIFNPNFDKFQTNSEKMLIGQYSEFDYLIGTIFLSLIFLLLIILCIWGIKTFLKDIKTKPNLTFTYKETELIHFALTQIPNSNYIDKVVTDLNHFTSATHVSDKLKEMNIEIKKYLDEYKY